MGEIFVAEKPKHKMSTADRAKQFMPFSALKGLDEALKEKEKIIEEQLDLSTYTRQKEYIKLWQLK